jgi:hypothetical protein
MSCLTHLVCINWQPRGLGQRERTKVSDRSPFSKMTGTLFVRWLTLNVSL